jgi:hypothetical protein
VAEAKARNGQRDARLRKVSDKKHSTPRSLSQTQAKARAKDRTQGGTHWPMDYIRANGAIGISLREHGRHIAHSVRTLLVSAPVPEREEDRGCDTIVASLISHCDNI